MAHHNFAGCPIEDAIDLTKHAEAAGADVISTSVPGAYDHLKGIKTEMTLEKTMDYFHKVRGTIPPLATTPKMCVRALVGRFSLHPIRPVSVL